MKETINDSTPVITVEQLRISSTEESTTIITESNFFQDIYNEIFIYSFAN